MSGRGGCGAPPPHASSCCPTCRGSERVALLSSAAVLSVSSCRRVYPGPGEDPANVHRLSAPYVTSPLSLFRSQNHLVPWSSVKEEAHPPALSLSTKRSQKQEKRHQRNNQLSFNNQPVNMQRNKEPGTSSNTLEETSNKVLGKNNG